MKRLFKIEFGPVLGTNDKQETVRVGRYMVYVVADDPKGIGGVVKHFLPQFSELGFTVVEEVKVGPKHRAWSVSIGSPGRTRNIMIVATTIKLATLALAEAVEYDPRMSQDLQLGLVEFRPINLSREGVA